jgi:hypothetical protein
MGGRRVDCCLSHTVAAFFGRFLALTTGIAGQQDNAASRALPDIKQLLSDVRENQKQIETQRLQEVPGGDRDSDLEEQEVRCAGLPIFDCRLRTQQPPRRCSSGIVYPQSSIATVEVRIWIFEFRV